MFKEVVPTRQIQDEPRRIWFIDDQMDLIAWYADDHSIIGFQLCDNKGPDEHALTWFQGKGYSYERVDDGEAYTRHPKMTPILLEDGVPDTDEILRHFQEREGTLPAGLRAFIRMKLLELKTTPLDGTPKGRRG